MGAAKYGSGKISSKDKSKAAAKRRKNTQNITELAIAARAAGMTYGQYVAKMGL